MAKLITLTVERDVDDAFDVSALDVGPARREAIIDKSELPDFYRNLIGLTPAKVAKFNEGFSIVAQIASDDWDYWLAGFEVVDD